MLQVQFEEPGIPEKVLKLVEVPEPSPKAGEALIKITARNINPSDVMFIQGLYGIVPKLPSGAGFEAAGTVVSSALYPAGTRVMFTAIGTWKEYICLPDQALIPVPEGMSDLEACQAFVNPMTAYGMLESANLKEGDHLLITAGASAWGKMVIQMGKERGIKVIATVRQEDQISQLQALGAHLVLNTSDAHWTKTLKNALADGVDAAFDAVGGELGAKALMALKPGACLWVFGLLSLTPIPLNSGLLIFKNLRVNGWWLSSWWDSMEGGAKKKALNSVLGAISQQHLQLDVAATYPLSEVQSALKAYQAEGRKGKIILT